MKTALIYPPTCDPTAPYISVPLLAAYLRASGAEVISIDANVEAYDRLLRASSLQALAKKLEQRLAQLERKPALGHADQLAYAALWEARGDGLSAPSAIEDALAVLRDRSGRRFFDCAQYHAAVEAVESALRLISAAYFPLTLRFTAYQTPFSLLTMHEIEADARPERNPFHDYFEQDLCARLSREGVGCVGLSVAFSSQLQPAYSLALMLRKKLPGAYITVGGPAITQLLCPLEKELQERTLGPFHSAILFEGESALLDVVSAVQQGERPTGILRGAQCSDLKKLPCPDFEGLPLHLYFSPALVLPYDPTRGCYWGKCAFCHYGLAETGTAPYRERPVDMVIEHVKLLSQRHGTSIFYFSQDALSPGTALRLAHAIEESGFPWRWSTDMRPEKSLSPEACRALARGGLLSAALGVESAAPRVLRLIDKGLTAGDMRAAITSLSEAGVAVEAMCFTDFPTETAEEALATLGFVDALRKHIALFICGCFDLVQGARVAQSPHAYGIKEIWHVAGDELRAGIFYEEINPRKNIQGRDKVEAALDRLSRRFRLSHYPWAGALSTAHTQLWYAHRGPDAFKKYAGKFSGRQLPRPPARTARACFDVKKAAQQSAEHEAEIWRILIREKRMVTREAYESLARALPPAQRCAGLWSFGGGEFPRRIKKSSPRKK